MLRSLPPTNQKKKKAKRRHHRTQPKDQLPRTGTLTAQISSIYTRDRSSVWDELGQRTVVRLIIRLCIDTGFQMDHPSRRIIHGRSSVKTNYRDHSSGRMIRIDLTHWTRCCTLKTTMSIIRLNTISFMGK